MHAIVPFAFAIFACANGGFLELLGLAGDRQHVFRAGPVNVSVATQRGDDGRTAVHLGTDFKSRSHSVSGGVNYVPGAGFESGVSYEHKSGVSGFGRFGKAPGTGFFGGLGVLFGRRRPEVPKEGDPRVERLTSSQGTVRVMRGVWVGSVVLVVARWILWFE